jgi:predicted RNA-binding protein with PUA-like domain
MPYWLMKSEPDEFSIDDLQSKLEAPWDGVRNYQARNFIRNMVSGDQVLFYHSSCKEVGIAGLMEVVGTHYPDPLAQDPESSYYDEKSSVENKWSAINVRYLKKFPSITTLQQIKNLAKSDQRLADLALLKRGNRLSVMPITDEQWQCLLELTESF